MKSRNEFDAEALRTAAYGFLAAAFFGDYEMAVRVFYVMISVAAYVAARNRLNS